jgi:hypothetical protein
MAINNNPISRLISIYQSAKTVNRKDPCTAIITWARVFEIPCKNNKLTKHHTIEVLNRIIQLEKLINEAEQLLLSVKGIKHERYLPPFATMRSSVQSDRLDSHGTTILSEEEMLILGFCEERIEELNIEAEVKDDQIKELLNDVNNLYEEVIASSLQDTLKALILEQLEHIRRAIHEYRISGVERLREEMPILVGNYILNKDLIEQESDKEEVKKFQAILSKFAATIEFASNAATLIEAAAHYLPKLLPGG